MTTNNTNTEQKAESIDFDSLTIDFNGQSFYGLEYVLDDFYQTNTSQTAQQVTASMDFFEW